MESTISPILKTNTSLSIAVRAGLKLPRQPSRTELRFSARQPGPISTLHPRFSFRVNKRMMDATVVTLTTHTSGFIKITSQMKLAQFTRQEVGTTESVAVL